MLELRSRKVRIYCHQMKSVTPREYITVEPQENYSIYYEYKTQLFDSCPPTSRAHEYVNDQNSGRTHFRKLRLNISDLRIIENDFEFADSRGQRQALGSAGDCYNRNMNCPQGDFSISLGESGFTLRPGTVWNTYGNRPVMKHSSDVSSAIHTASVWFLTFPTSYFSSTRRRCRVAPSAAASADAAPYHRHRDFTWTLCDTVLWLPSWCNSHLQPPASGLIYESLVLLFCVAPVHLDCLLTRQHYHHHCQQRIRFPCQSKYTAAMSSCHLLLGERVVKCTGVICTKHTNSIVLQHFTCTHTHAHTVLRTGDNRLAILLDTKHLLDFACVALWQTITRVEIPHG